MKKNNFLLLKNLKNTESAQLWMSQLPYVRPTTTSRSSITFEPHAARWKMANCFGSCMGVFFAQIGLQHHLLLAFISKGRQIDRLG